MNCTSRFLKSAVIKIDRNFPSSKRCSSCGNIVEKLPLSIREWNCPECSSHHDRDLTKSEVRSQIGEPSDWRRTVERAFRPE
ncbi:zinc ribbon domain-containing protein [Okeania sp. SIO2C9]|uniref:zinc ribbon domain-containing protein n=1 Tax=Okeania sp. SIO2C9 TaxID=2607791 RepID=UPI00345D4B52